MAKITIEGDDQILEFNDQRYKMFKGKTIRLGERYYLPATDTIGMMDLFASTSAFNPNGIGGIKIELIKNENKMKQIKRIFVICSVRGTSDEYKRKLEEYVANLESEGHLVHLPHRNTNQNGRGIEICSQNAEAIKRSDEVHIFYNSASQGTHFDMGVAFAYRKPLVVVENEVYGEGKSYPRMIDEWSKELK